MLNFVRTSLLVFLWFCVDLNPVISQSDENDKRTAFVQTFLAETMRIENEILMQADSLRQVIYELELKQGREAMLLDRINLYENAMSNACYCIKDEFQSEVLTSLLKSYSLTDSFSEIKLRILCFNYVIKNIVLRHFVIPDKLDFIRIDTDIYDNPIGFSKTVLNKDFFQINSSEKSIVYVGYDVNLSLIFSYMTQTYKDILIVELNGNALIPQFIVKEYNFENLSNNVTVNNLNEFINNDNKVDADLIILNESFNKVENREKFLSTAKDILKSKGSLKMIIDVIDIWKGDKAWRKKYKSGGFQHAMFCNNFETQHVEDEGGIYEFHFNVRSK